jgi:hypothetical protein
MDLKSLLANLTPKEYGDLTVDDTVGGVGFDPAKLTWQSLPAKVVRVTTEGGDFRYKEVSEPPTASSGDLMSDGDEFFVAGEGAVKNFRAIRVGAVNAALRYHVYF